MKKVFCALISVLLMLSFCSCVMIESGEEPESESISAQPVFSATPIGGSFVFTAENMPVIGCTSAYERLAIAFAGAALGVTGEQAAAFVRVSTGMRACYSDFVAGKTQLIIAPAPDRSMSEIAYNSDFLWKYTALGKDALVFLCYRGNALDNISLLNLRYLYQGCYKNWSELGGFDTPMLIYSAPEGSASRILFDSLFGVPEEYIQTEMTEYYDSVLGYVSARAEYTEQKGSIGCSTYNYCALGTHDVLSYSKLLSLDGVSPDRQTLNSGAYPFVYDFGILLADATPEDSPAEILYEWMCSEQGRQLSAVAGY